MPTTGSKCGRRVALAEMRVLDVPDINVGNIYACVAQRESIGRTTPNVACSSHATGKLKMIGENVCGQVAVYSG